MTLSIPLSPEIEARIRQRAAASGKDLTAFVLEAVEEKLRLPQTFAEILAPVHEEFGRTGMTPEQLDDFGRELIQRVRAENKPKPA